MRAIFREMKSLTERNSEYMELLANAEQAKRDASSTHASYVEGGEGKLSEDHTDIDNVTREQVVMAEEVAEIQSFDELPIFADPREYDWETDNMGDCQEAEESENHLTLLQKLMSAQVGHRF